MSGAGKSVDGVPYKIACLCEVRDAEGRVLLLHRRRPPNRDLYSPIGGKLEQREGESPTACALREIREEAGLELAAEDLHLLGIVSERAFCAEDDGETTHWLMFWFRVVPAVDPASVPSSFEEGTLEWFGESELEGLPLPATDREAIWPAVRAHSRGAALGFFALHLDCDGGASPRVRVEQSWMPGVDAGSRH